MSQSHASELWPDDDDWAPKEAAPAPSSFGESGSGRAIVYGLGGIGVGAIVGALGSIIVASIVNADCFSDSCVGAFVPHGAVVGALIGLVVGVIVSRQGKRVEYRSLDGDHL